MRAFFITIAILIVLALGYLGFAQVSGGAVPTFGLPLGGERAKVRKTIKLFFEDVRFKNKNAISNVVTPGATLEDIENFLTQFLGASANQVDLLDVHIHSVELDSNHQRARAVVNIKAKNLNDSTSINVTRLIFLFMVDQNWIIDIKNPSL